MEWVQVCSDPILKNLPYKIELNEWGKIVMSPVSIKHILYQEKIAEWLRKLLKQGKALQEFPVQITDTQSVKVADVVWISEEILNQVSDQFASPIAPEICIEVISPDNTQTEMLEKKDLYFRSGATEFWICHENGKLEFFNANGAIDQSIMVPEFPDQIQI